MDNRMNYCPMMQMYGNQMPCNMQSPMMQEPNEQMPMMNMPNSNMPMQQMPMQHMPNSNMPMQQMPMMNMPNSNMPMQQMPVMNMPNSNMPMQQMPMMNMPNAQMPMMNMPMMDMEDEEMEMDIMDMYPDCCKKMMPYVAKEIDKMEKKDEMLYDKYMDKNMIEQMANKAFDEMAKEMPEVKEENETMPVSNIAQFGRRRNFGRDLFQILFLNELFRRGRRRRRRRHDSFESPFFPFGF